MGILDVILDLPHSNPLLLWVLGIMMPIIITVIIPKIRRKIKKIFHKILLKFQGDDVGINAVYLKNYLGSPNGKLTDEIFEKIKNEIQYDKIQKVSIHPRFLKIRSNKLGMKLVISIEQEQIEIEDEEYQKIPYNVSVEMDADIKGSSNIHNLSDFINIAEKIHEIIRTTLFAGIDLNQSYVVCTINNTLNDIASDSKKSFKFEDNEITLRKDSTTILAHSPHSITQTLKKYA